MVFYKKKKRKVGPSKNEEKVRRGQAAEAEASAAGTLSTHFPQLRGLKLSISITSPQGVVLAEDSEHLEPGDALLVQAECSGRCGSGSYDFTQQVADALSAGQASGQLEAACAESAYGAEACGCVARCKFEAER